MLGINILTIVILVIFGKYIYLATIPIAMQRKVVKQGNDSLTVTLPKRWTQMFNIKAGDSLTVKVKNNTMELSTSEISADRKITITISQNNPVMIRYTLGALFRSGIDEVTINFSENSTLTAINSILVHKLKGLMIIDQTVKSCTIRSITSDDEKNLAAIINRNFLIVSSLADNCYNHLEKNEFRKIEELQYLHENSNQSVALCQRIIIKNSYNNIIESSFRIALIENLELLCDSYSDICAICSKRKKPFIYQKQILEYFFEINSIFKKLIRLVLNFKENEISDLFKCIGNCREKVEIAYDIAKDEQIKILHLFLVSLDLLKNFIPTMIVLHINTIENKE